MNHRCPDEETLAAYFDGLLPPQEEAALHAELRACPDCARLVATLGLVIDAEEPEAWQRARVPEAVTRRALDLWPAEPGPAARAVRLAVRWIGEQLQPLADALAPLPDAAVALRGGTAGAAAAHDELRYEVDVGDLPLSIDLEVEGPGQLALTVRPRAAPPPGALLRLTRDGETRALSSLTPDGSTLPALPAGTYTLQIEAAGRALGELTLDLEA